MTAIRPLLPEPIDTLPLTEPLERADVRREWRALVREHHEARDFIGPVRLVSGVFFVLFFTPAMTYAGIEMAAAVASSRLGIVLGSAAAVVFVATLTVSIARSTVRLWARRTRRATHVRLARFAAANGLEYRPGPTGSQRGGPWRGRGSLNLHRVMRRDDEGRSLEIADYEIFGNSGNLARRFGGYCALRLPTPLPHMMLRSQGRSRSTPLSASEPDGAQRLGLEGDFDRSFHLYCPAGYERDALYLFTPDVMVRLLDHARGFDVEVVDDWLLLIDSDDLVTTRPERWRTLATAVDALDDRIERWGRWRESQPSPAAAPTRRPLDDWAARSLPAGSRGRRLRLRWRPITVISLIVTALVAGSVLAELLHIGPGVGL